MNLKIICDICRMLRFTYSILFLCFSIFPALSQDISIAYDKQENCNDTSFCKLGIKITYQSLEGMLRLKQFWPSGIEVKKITNQPEIIFNFSQGTSTILWQNIPKSGTLDVEIAYRFRLKPEKALVVHAHSQAITNGKRIEIELSPFTYGSRNTSDSRTYSISKNSNKVSEEKVHFRIQLGSDRDDEQEQRFASLFGIPVQEIQVDMLLSSFVYTFGQFSTLEEARAELQKNSKMKGKAFVAGFKGNERIELEEAIKLTRKTP